MNRKTICRVMGKMMSNYLASIEDESVRAIMKEQGYVTGGSIVSMLLNEKISDFDFYLKTKEAVLAVTNYYVKKFNTNNPWYDVRVLDEDDRVKIFIQSNGVASEEERDVQQEEYNEAVTPQGVVEKEDNDDGEHYRPVYLSANAITLSDKVQIIIRFYGEVEEVHKNYDFVHCTNSWDCKTGKLTLRSDAMESILAKHLVYNGSLYPVCSVIRTRKFIRRGWHINAGQYLKMCFQISELDLTDIGVLEDQLTGVDSAYFHQLITYCKNRKKEDESFNVTVPYLIEIVDRVFN